MNGESVIVLSLGIFLIALLYSSVGHAGASGYIALMTLAGMDPGVIKPAALLLNILVAIIGSWQFYRKGHFSFSLFWPFAIVSVPFAFLGGYLQLPAELFKLLIGVILLYSSLRLLIDQTDSEKTHMPDLSLAMPMGAGIGFISGLSGVGGGIFLTPLLIQQHWAATKTAAAISAPFILVNSLAGISGSSVQNPNLPFVAMPFALSAIIGGSIGSRMGSTTLPPIVIKRILGAALLIASYKLIFIR